PGRRTADRAGAAQALPRRRSSGRARSAPAPRRAGSPPGCPGSRQPGEYAPGSRAPARRRGLLFVGLDVIGDYLTEINVTSPTCIREIDAAFDTDIGGKLMDCIEQQLKARHSA